MIEGGDLMRFHVEALFTRDAAGRLVAVNDPAGGPAPRFFLGRTAVGSACWFRADVGADLAAELVALAGSLSPGLEREGAPAFAAPFLERLSQASPILRTWAGPAFRFPLELPPHVGVVRVAAENAGVLTPYLESWRPDAAAGIPLFASLDGGRAVSVCGSVRQTTDAHEAGVETHRDFRGRRHAVRATAAWARAVRETGRVPLYSTSWENTSSRALAERLGLIQFGSDLHIT